MFQWSYFFLYVGLGFGVGLTHNVHRQPEDARPSDQLIVVIGTIFWGAVIWNFFTFGISWGALAVVEGFVGYLIGQKVRKS